MKGRAHCSSLFPILCQLRGYEQSVPLAIHEQERILSRLANGSIEVGDVRHRLVIDFLDHITLPQPRVSHGA